MLSLPSKSFVPEISVPAPAVFAPFFAKSFLSRILTLTPLFSIPYKPDLVYLLDCNRSGGVGGTVGAFHARPKLQKR